MEDRKLETYGAIYAKLEDAVKEYIDINTKQPEMRKEINKIQLAQQRKTFKMKNMYLNDTIEDEELLKTIEKQYTSLKPSPEYDGEIGTTESVDQIDGITNLAFLALISNRITKLDIPEKDKKMYYTKKDDSISSLIANITVLNYTDKNNKDNYLYGTVYDINTKAGSFAINLPNFGPIRFHFGTFINKRRIIKEAAKKANSILQRKLELGQISQEELDKINLNNKNILPDYPLLLFENITGFPFQIENLPPNIQKLMADTKKRLRCRYIYRRERYNKTGK